MTFADVIAGAKYAIRYAELNAQLNAVNVGKLFTHPQTPGMNRNDKLTLHNSSEHSKNLRTDNGILQLQRNNIGYYNTGTK